jgi:hypothetical protein
MCDCGCTDAGHERCRSANPVAHPGVPCAVHFHHGVPRRDYPCAGSEGWINLFSDQALQQTNFDQVHRYCPGEARRRKANEASVVWHFARREFWSALLHISLKPEQRFSSYGQKWTTRARSASPNFWALPKPCSLASLAKKSTTPSGPGRPRQHRIHGDARVRIEARTAPRAGRRVMIDYVKSGSKQQQSRWKRRNFAKASATSRRR